MWDLILAQARREEPVYNAVQNKSIKKHKVNLDILTNTFNAK